MAKKDNFGMLSVKAGIDNNPDPTHADRIAGAKGMKKGGRAKNTRRMNQLEELGRVDAELPVKVVIIERLSLGQV